MKTSTQLSRCCWDRKTKLRATEQWNFTWGGGSIDHQFRRLFTKFCVSSATRKGTLNSWLKRTACNHALFSVCSLRDDNVITSKPTWKPKHADSMLETFEYFYQMPSKSIHVISSYTVSKLGRFFWDTVYVGVFTIKKVKLLNQKPIVWGDSCRSIMELKSSI